MKVPYLDLKAHNRPLREVCLEAIAEVIDSSAFAGGSYVDRFERDFARYCGVRQAVGVGSGTDALFFGLAAMGVGPGDEVVSPPNTFVAIAEAVARLGACLTFADVQESTGNLDPDRLEAAITPRTKAIVPTHLFGRMADMESIMAIANRHGVPVLEDASQAHGARSHGRKAGAFGQAAAFSFYPGKNLGAFGDAGMLVTNDDAIATEARILREHGQRIKSRHDRVGWTGRMDGVQAAVLRLKLRHLDEWNAQRRLAAERYRQRLAELEGIQLLDAGDQGEWVHHVFPIRVSQRDQLMQSLQSRGIGCSVHYPIPLHLQEAYRSLGYSVGDFPVAERSCRSLLSLPIYPELSCEQIDYVCAALAEELGLVASLTR